MGKPLIEKELLDEIPKFENFLSRIGFKRIEGAVYGLLVLSEAPLTSTEIETILGLSQSAVSQSIKNLAHFGAVDTFAHPEEKRVKLYSPKEDSLSIVASVFRKREQEAIEEFRNMAEKILRKTENYHGARAKRLQSIILTCQVGEAVMSFVIGMAQKGLHVEYPQIVKKIPKALDLILATGEPTLQFAENIRSSLTGKLKDGFSKIAGEING